MVSRDVIKGPRCKNCGVVSKAGTSLRDQDVRTAVW